MPSTAVGSIGSICGTKRPAPSRRLPKRRSPGVSQPAQEAAAPAVSTSSMASTKPIATQIVRQDLGFESIQEIDYGDVFKGCSVYCEMIVTREQARRKTVAACQAALTRRGVAVLVVPADVANAAAHEEPPYAVHARRPLVRPSDEDLDAI